MVVSILISIYDYIRKHEYWVNKFRFCSLPRVAQIEVLRSMNYSELMNMAWTSYNIRIIIKSIRIELPEYQVYFKGPWSCLQMNDSSISEGQKFLEWLSSVREEEDCHEEVASSVWRVQYLFICKKVHLVIDFDEKDEIDIIDNQFLLDMLKNCDTLVLMNGEIKSKDFEFILKTMKASYLETREMTIPVDFQSENAFRPIEVRYGDSKWVKLEALFTLKGLTYIRLYSHTFDVSDFNILLKHWKTNENDMFKFLLFELSERIDIETLFAGLTVLKNVWHGGDFYFCFSTPDTKKTKEILCVWFLTEEMRLTVQSPDDRFLAFDVDEPFATCGREFEILKILEKKEELEKKLTSDNNEDLPSIRMELDEINENLKNEGVVFLDGIYVI